MIDYILWLFLKALPLAGRKGISRFVGELAHLPLPKEILQVLIWLYCFILRFDPHKDTIAEVRHFSTFSDFFCRPLRPECRSLQGDIDEVLSPCDGTLASFGPVSPDLHLTQIKGWTYPLEELIQSPAKEWDKGFFFTIYLSPKDYHRFHTPTQGTLTYLHYLPGDVWPVLPSFLSLEKNLFAQNERIVLRFQTPYGPYLFLPVGALNVASIRIHNLFPPRPLPRRPWKKTCQRSYEQGEELGWFDMGSTIILIFPATFQPSPELREGQKLQVGQPLGRWQAK